ncbi:MAG: SDR family NAD(P)-dependent oxidoreductase, partial [Parvularculaceae bacterium]|nr:SDR family NAD(P)-dependent oxidoreductase [Parvularculaceae bacterium]
PKPQTQESRQWRKPWGRRMIYRDRWALVTGASAGIGAAFARALAARGAHVALVARRADRLEALAEELRSTRQVKARTLAFDLKREDAPESIMAALGAEGVAPDILVNNAGYGLPGAYLANPWSEHRDFIAAMTTSYAHLTHAALPAMRQRGWGRIIQVASVAGLVPGGAGHTLYGASKAFLVSFAQSLAAECEGTGVKVSALCPGFTYSEFHDVNGTRALVSRLPRLAFMQAEPVVDGAIAAVERGHVVYVPGAFNKLVVGFAKALPRPWAAALVTRQSAKFRRFSATD